MWRRLDLALNSHALAATLILALAVGSVSGTVPVEGADQVYWSWWYLSGLALLVTLMVYATVRRLPGLWFEWRRMPSTRALPGPDVHTADPISIAGTTADAADRLTQVLRRRGFRLRAAAADGEGRTLVYDRGRAGMVGPTLLHIGLVVALTGGWITHQYGSVRNIELGEGDILEIPEVDAQIRLAKFSIITAPDTHQPEAYVSTLEVRRGAGEGRFHQVRVNHPLTVAGTTFFQMRYRPELREVVLGVYGATAGEPVREMRLESGERTRVPGADVAVTLGQVVPDFAVDDANNILTRSPYFLNPAVALTVYAPADAGEPAWQGWAYKNMLPTHDPPPLPLQFAISRVNVKYYSGMRLSYDPGVPVAYAGFLLLVVGAFLSSFLFHRLLRAELTPAATDGTCALQLSGCALKHRPDFAYEWTRLAAHVNRALEV